MFRLLITIAFLLLAPAALAKEIKIASWNIAWLNAENESGKVKRNDDDYARLQGYAKTLDADVIAIQEASGKSAVSRVFPASDYNVSCSKRNAKQRTCFAIKKTVEYQAEPDLEELNTSRGLRRGAVISLLKEGKPALTLMNVHLKSFCFAKDLDNPSDDACKKLKAQVPVLEGWIDEKAAASVPFMVLGDWNRRMKKDNDDLWREIDDAEPANADLNLVDVGAQNGCWDSQYPDYIDHIVAGKRAAEMVVPGSGGQLLFKASDKDHKKELSDHCPIYATVKLAD